MAQYRNFPSPDGTAPGGPVSHTSEYQRSTPDSIALSPYSDSEPQHCHPQNGGSSSSSGLGRPSPTQTSPLSHTPSPAYPIYNSPMSAPSPLHEAQSCVYSKPTPPSQQPAAYPSVIQCNTSQAEAKQVSHSRQNFPHSLKQSWDMQEKIARGVRDMSQSNVTVSRFSYGPESMEVLDEGMLAANESLAQQRQVIYETSPTMNMHELPGGPSNEELLVREAEAEEYDRRRGRKFKRRKSGEKAKPPQNCGYPAIQNGYFPSAYHDNFMARNALGGYHPRLGFNPAHMHGQPSPAHSQCGPNAMYQMGPLPLSVQQQGPSCAASSPPPPEPPEKAPLQGPSVDDELGFLEDSAPVAAPPTLVNNPIMKPSSSKDSSGFMDSYLKFLRGETETPLTISVRAGRKSPKVADTPRKNNSNSKIGSSVARNQVTKVSTPITATPATSTVASAPKPCLPFQQVATTPLLQPCDTKKHQESAPVGLPAPLRQQPDMPSCYLEEKRPHKEMCPEPAALMNVDMRARAAEARAREDMNSHRIRGRPPKRSAPHQEEVTEVVPTRPQRKAKEAAIQGRLGELSDGEEPVDLDSDSDPAWTPPLAEANGDNFSVKKGLQAPPKSRDSSLESSEHDEIPKKRKRKSIDITLAEQQNMHAKGRRIQTVGSGSDSDSNEVRRTSRPLKKRFSYKDPVRADEIPSATVQVSSSPKPRTEELHDEEKRKLFVSGAFIIPKAEMTDESPNIWKIDGRNLLQKFEAFDEDGKIYYRNVSTYSGWTPESYRNYEIADVMFIKNTRQETILHLNREDVWRGVEALKKRFRVELEDYLNPFRTYLQTLVSQVLDGNFISVIVSENDEYFVSNLDKVDEMFEKKRSQMRNVIQLKGNTEDLINTWPSYRIDSLDLNIKCPTCATCESCEATMMLVFNGERYEKTTLAVTEIPDDGSHSMEFPACKICEPYIDLYSRLVHLKFNYYKLCVVKVQEIKDADPNIDTSELLQSVLQAEWIDRLFRGLQDFFAKIELIVFSSKAMADTD